MDSKTEFLLAHLGTADEMDPEEYAHEMLAVFMPSIQKLVDAMNNTFMFHNFTNLETPAPKPRTHDLFSDQAATPDPAAGRCVYIVEYSDGFEIQTNLKKSPDTIHGMRFDVLIREDGLYDYQCANNRSRKVVRESTYYIEELCAAIGGWVVSSVPDPQTREQIATWMKRQDRGACLSVPQLSSQGRPNKFDA